MLLYESNWIIRFGESDINIEGKLYVAVFGIVGNSKNRTDTYVRLYDLINDELLYGRKYGHIGSNWIDDFDGDWQTLNCYLREHSELKEKILSLAVRYQKLKAFI